MLIYSPPPTLSRRNLLGSLLTYAAAIAVSPALTQSATNPRPKVGAIRWDAWYSPGSEPTNAVTRSLSPQHYHWRAPFFARKEDGTLRFPSLSKELIDLEIRQAAYAGLDYWAFVAYEQDSPMSAALRYYLASPERHRVNFCMFTALESWGTASHPAPLLNDHILLMMDKAYVRVFDGRPLYFLGFISRQKANDRWGGLDRLRSAIHEFRNHAIERGAGNPYIVLAGYLREVKDWAAHLGGDAIGSYALGDMHGRGTFAKLAQFAEAGWKTLSETGLPVVPTAMVGLDRRPRVENPVPWERTQRRGAGIQFHFDPPTPYELTTHLLNALDFAQNNPVGGPAPAVLIYAWNENDEGGWLLPTIPCHSERIETLHNALARQTLLPNPGCVIGRP